MAPLVPQACSLDAYDRESTHDVVLPNYLATLIGKLKFSVMAHHDPHEDRLDNLSEEVISKLSPLNPRHEGSRKSIEVMAKCKVIRLSFQTNQHLCIFEFNLH